MDVRGGGAEKWGVVRGGGWPRGGEGGGGEWGQWKREALKEFKNSRKLRRGNGCNAKSKGRGNHSGGIES